MTKTKGRRRRKNSREEEQLWINDGNGSSNNNSNNNGKNETGSIADERDAVASTRSSRKHSGSGSNNKSDLSFAERRELQRKAAAEKRRQKMKVSSSEIKPTNEEI